MSTPAPSFNVDPAEFNRLQRLVGVRFMSSVPTHRPLGNRPELVVYESGGTTRLYAFVPSLGTWHYVALT